MKTFRFVTARQRQYDAADGSWQWYALDEEGRYLKGFDEKLVPCGRYRISSAPKTGRFKVSGRELYVRKGGGWQPVDCPTFCSYGMRELGIKPGRAFNVIPVRRVK